MYRSGKVLSRGHILIIKKRLFRVNLRCFSLGHINNCIYQSLHLFCIILIIGGERNGAERVVYYPCSRSIQYRAIERWTHVTGGRGHSLSKKGISFLKLFATYVKVLKRFWKFTRKCGEEEEHS